MDRLMMVNGSPRAPRSNTRRYLQLLEQYWPGETREYSVTQGKHEQGVAQLEGCGQLVLAFPLYADSLPVTLMGFLKALEAHPPAPKPTVHVLINCGFLEPEQNRVALEIIDCFCRRSGYPRGATLCIGSGEAILGTPFAFFARRAIRKLARAIQTGRPARIKTAMPLTKGMFLKASTNYWLGLGAKNSLTREDMAVMDIEGGVLPPREEKP